MVRILETTAVLKLTYIMFFYGEFVFGKRNPDKRMFVSAFTCIIYFLSALAITTIIIVITILIIILFKPTCCYFCFHCSSVYLCNVAICLSIKIKRFLVQCGFNNFDVSLIYSITPPQESNVKGFRISKSVCCCACMYKEMKNVSLHTTRLCSQTIYDLRKLKTIPLFPPLFCNLYFTPIDNTAHAYFL